MPPPWSEMVVRALLTFGAKLFQQLVDRQPVSPREFSFGGSALGGGAAPFVRGRCPIERGLHGKFSPLHHNLRLASFEKGAIV